MLHWIIAVWLLTNGLGKIVKALDEDRWKEGAPLLLNGITGCVFAIMAAAFL
jgi:uncharacterized membrane protein HdeD (DUF308 family)